MMQNPWIRSVPCVVVAATFVVGAMAWADSPGRGLTARFEVGLWSLRSTIISRQYALLNSPRELRCNELELFQQVKARHPRLGSPSRKPRRLSMILSL